MTSLTNPSRIVEEIEIKKINTAGRGRQNFDPTKLKILIESITETGLLHPIVVMQYEETYSGYDYYLIAGERRIRAFKELGRTTIPASVFKEGDLDSYDMKLSELMENVAREAFTWDEEVALKARIHDLHVRKYGLKTSTLPGAPGHSVPATAALFNESAENTRRDLRLAKLLELKPELRDKFKNKTEAFRKIKLAEKRIELEATIDTKKQEGSIDERAIQLANSYVVKDFFKAAEKIDNETFHLINIDIDYPMDIRDEDSLHVLLNDDVAKGKYHKISREDYAILMPRAISEAYRLLKPNGWAIIWFGFEYYEWLRQTLLDNKFFVNFSIGLWVNSPSTRNPDIFLGRSIEPFFYARKGQATLQRPRGDLFLYHKAAPHQRAHPFEKPVPLCSDILTTFTIPGASVLDCFAGSGNMMKAAVNSGMFPIGFDLSEAYKERFAVDVQVQKYGHYV